MAVKILLKQARGAVSLNELARLTGISPQFLSRIENGKANPSLETLDKICKGLGEKTGSITWIVYEADSVSD